MGYKTNFETFVKPKDYNIFKTYLENVRGLFVD